MNWRIGARTACWIKKHADRFTSRVQLSDGVLTADGKNIMMVLMLAGCHEAGDRLTLIVEGADSDVAMAKMAELFTIGERLDRCPYHACPSTPILVSYTDEWIQYGCSKWHSWCSPRDNLMREANEQREKTWQAHA